jgi:hypothetical protein
MCLDQFGDETHRKLHAKRRDMTALAMLGQVRCQAVEFWQSFDDRLPHPGARASAVQENNRGTAGRTELPKRQTGRGHSMFVFHVDPSILQRPIYTTGTDAFFFLLDRSHAERVMVGRGQFLSIKI